MKKRQGRAAKKVSSASCITPSIPLSLPSLIGKGKGVVVILVDGSRIVEEIKRLISGVEIPRLYPENNGIERLLPIRPERMRADIIKIQDFDQFWSRYPNKTYKQHSFKTFFAVRASGVTIKQIADALIEKIKAGAPMPPAYRFLRSIKK